ncbi:MAG: EAL domain-containing protein [Ruminiclostridium sp.]|nr:EAL domain-containing protein [Ruminiclostridium sp.]
MGYFTNQGGYTPVCDVAVTALCMIVALLLFISNVHKNKSFWLMLGMVVFIWTAAAGSLTYQMLMSSNQLNYAALVAARLINHTSLSAVQLLYVLYLREPLWMSTSSYKRFVISISAVAAAPILIDIIGMITGFGFRVKDESVITSFSIYPFSFTAFVAIIFYLIIKYRNRIIRQVFWSLFFVNLISLIVSAVQGIYRQSSFTTLAYFMPVLGLLFTFHSNPYDSETGAANDIYFSKELASCIEKNTGLYMISCYISGFNSRMRSMPQLKSEFYRFFKQNVKRGILYRFPNGRLVLTLKQKRYRNSEETISAILDDFYKSYEFIRLDYKIVVAETTPELRIPEEYIKLIEQIESSMSYNKTRRVTESDIGDLKDSLYILSELQDISRRQDLSDERVLVYCQPVFNLATGKYDTAEALMRLKLPETGLVFPDKFIPIAEKHDLIHQLSMIILNKTCLTIQELMSEGYYLNRISVNFSTLDIRQDTFCFEVQDIIERSGIPYGKIAVEITESRSELEFNRMKNKVTELQGLGIKFYLDDFGTGYSNFERIMEIPFDIIKFDRSMLVESVKNDSSKFMVSTFASMFNDLNYSVLFEGVEDERDERHCVDMHARYLQGYKYSKPIPIEDLRNFLSKEAG